MAKRKNRVDSDEDSGGGDDHSEESFADDTPKKVAKTKKNKENTPPARKKKPDTAGKLEPAAFKSEQSAPTLESAPTSSAVSADITKGPPITTDAAAKRLILQYMTVQNRPYSSIQINDNLHKRIPKANLERVLATLSEPGGGLLCKEYGKAKIYFVDQATLKSNFTAEQLSALECENDRLRKSAETLKSEEKSFSRELDLLKNSPVDAELDRYYYPLWLKRYSLQVSTDVPVCANPAMKYQQVNCRGKG